MFKKGHRTSMQDRIAKRSKVVGDCLVWTGKRHKSGYGYVTINKKSVRAHRQVWIEAFGEIPEDLVVRHKCDNPPCVKLDHLELGTFKQNAEDRDQRGRRKNGTTVIDADTVRLVRCLAADGLRQVDISALLALRSTHVHKIVHNVSWTSVQ